MQVSSTWHCKHHWLLAAFPPFSRQPVISFLISSSELNAPQQTKTHERNDKEEKANSGGFVSVLRHPCFLLFLRFYPAVPHGMIEAHTEALLLPFFVMNWFPSFFFFFFPHLLVFIISSVKDPASIGLGGRGGGAAGEGVEKRAISKKVVYGTGLRVGAREGGEYQYKGLFLSQEWGALI